jgi:hypothetical protein
MKCEHCGWRSAMRNWIICKKCWKMFMGDIEIPLKGKK